MEFVWDECLCRNRYSIACDAEPSNEHDDPRQAWLVIDGKGTYQHSNLLRFRTRNQLFGTLSFAVRKELLHCAISLVDRRVGVRVGRGIRVGDSDPPERFTRERARLVFRGPLGVPQGIVLVGIPVWPP